jgi:fibronectin-binding autotransporter adhesin
VTPVSTALTVASDTVTGTTGADTVSGARIDTVQTLNNGDSISLGDGADTLTANLNAGTVAPTLTGVETVQLTALGAAVLDFVNTTGVTSIVNTASSGALTVDNIAALAPVTITNTNQATTIVFKDAAVAGTGTSATLNLTGVSGGIITMGGETDADGGIETINIAASGTNTTGNIALGTTATSVVVTGSGSLDINAGAEFALFTSFDASAATGDVDVAFADRATTSTTLDLSVTTGSGNDDVSLALVVDADVDNLTVDLGAGDDRLILDANTDTGNSIAGGTGTDTLQLDIAMTAAAAAYASGFETLEFNAGADITQDMDAADGMNTVNIFDMGAAGRDLNLDDVQDGITINANGAALASTSAATIADMTTLSVDLKTDTASDDMTLNLNAAAGGVTIGDFTPNASFETVTVNSSGTAGNEILDVSTAKVNMIFTGATALTVTTTGALLGVADASAMTAAFTTTTSTTAITVLGGTGNDTMTSGLLATGVTQTFTGGAGNDTLTAGQIVTTGNLVLNGGAGSDTINVADMDGNTTGTVVSTAVLDGGAGVDFLTLDAVNTLVLVNIGSTVTASADADVVVDFDTTEDDFLYTGALNNDGVTTNVVNLSTTLDTALAGDVNATIYIDSGNLTGAANTTLATLANARTVEATTAATTAFIDALCSAEGTIALLDNTISGTETVLMAFENGLDTAVVRFTNSDTTVANTMVASEVELVAVFDAAVLVAADFA